MVTVEVDFADHDEMKQGLFHTHTVQFNPCDFGLKWRDQIELFAQQWVASTTNCVPVASRFVTCKGSL